MSLKLSRPALVCRAPVGALGQDQYLRMTEEGAPFWTEDPATATAFESMREATRAALRLPAGLKAFGLPAPAERAVTVH